MSDYVAGLPNAEQLLDMVASGQEQRETKANQGQWLYPEVGYLNNVTAVR